MTHITKKAQSHSSTRAASTKPSFSTDQNRIENRLKDEDLSAHGWYRFILSFPPHLVRKYLEKFQALDSQVVLDPFCGTGTTIVECKKQSVSSIGIEALPMAHFASKVKTDWSPDPAGLMEHARSVAEEALARFEMEGVEDIPFFSGRGEAKKLRALTREENSLLLKRSISPLPLHKTLALMDLLNERRDSRYYQHERLALAKALVDDISNLKFGPEIGVGRFKEDAPVIAPWLSQVRAISDDLILLRQLKEAKARVLWYDSRRVSEVIKPNSVDVVITSPPYPNEKDYTRTTRLETVLLGFLSNKEDLRNLKKTLLRSNTRGVYKADNDDLWVESNKRVNKLSRLIENRRLDLGKTSGFERLYPRVTKLYFGGMARHLDAMKRGLRPGAYLAYVVGDLASYLRVMIRTGQLLAEIAETLGYEVVDIELFRTRLATTTKEQLREEVVILRWPGE